MTGISRFEDYSAITNDIKVTVAPEIIKDRTQPKSNIYAFSYIVLIENLGEKTVQLINRHWIIMVNGKQFADVKGEGVVGQQPVLEPRKTFQYSSWVAINETVGEMEGEYTFQDLTDNSFFNVKIPKFDLIYVDRNVVH